MPEGDVLRRTARRLTAALVDGPLVRAELRWPTLADIDLTGRRSLGTVSYGKHLFTRFDDGATLHTHLRMDGTWRVARTLPHEQTGKDGPERGTVRVVLATATWTCRGHLIGMMDLVRTRDEHLLTAHLGPDLLADDAEDHLTAPAARIAAARGRTIGEVLLDQSVAAGIGTIWMAETLFRHRISPWRDAADVDGAALLATASRLMRSSADSTGGPGSSESVPIAVHGRERQPCPRCGTPITVGRVGRPPFDRPAFSCPTCQAT